MAVIPENINFEQAAASLEGAHYAYNFVTKVNVRAGDKVLVNGATGAIGSAAVAILKHLGAEVTVVCPGSQFDAVRALGADHLIDFTKVDFTKDDSTRDSGKFAFVFDAVGKSQFAKCRPILEKRGVYISSELGPNSENLFYSAVTPLLMGKRVVFPVPVDIMRTIRFLLPLLETGKFVPLIDRSFSLDNIGEAYEYVASGQKIGNVVLKI